MRASRLLSILMMLQARGRTSAQRLADEVEVSVRTIYRDVDQLCAAGVPVVVERGSKGGFSLMDGWRTRLTGLTRMETQALLVAGLPGPAAELGLGEAMAAAELKVVAALPAGAYEDATRVRARLHVDPVSWYRRATKAAYLTEVAAAVWSERRLKIRYDAWAGPATHVVDPLGLVLKGGEWYVVAIAKRKPRPFRVSNILALTATGDSFTRPQAFDLPSYWKASVKEFEASLYKETAVVRVSDRGRKRLFAFGATVAEAIERQAPVADAAGWRMYTIPIESIDHAVNEVLRLGPEGEVLEPPALRERVRDTLARAAAQYT